MARVWNASSGADKCTNELRALEALREGRTEDACAAFEEAEEIYRIL